MSWFLLDGGSGGGGLPPVPTRDELIAIRCPLQGLRVSLSLGTFHWFEPALGWLGRLDDRQAVYAAKRARVYPDGSVGDSHVNLTLSGSYRESDQEYASFAGRDFSQDLGALRALITEAICAGTHLRSGFKILLMLAGDGLSTPDRSYNDPAGMTYGHEWLMEHFPRVYGALKGTNGEGPDLTPWIVWCPGYDGVVPGWAGPENEWQRVDRWLLFARSVVGIGVLALELAAGYWAWSGETDDYNATRPDGSKPGRELDVMLYEGPIPMGPPGPIPAGPYDRAPWDPNWNQVLQISKRILGPFYKRPTDLPGDYDPGLFHDGPLSQSTPRGPRSAVAFEVSTYLDVRDAESAQRIADEWAYMRAMGWTYP